MAEDWCVGCGSGDHAIALELTAPELAFAELVAELRAQGFISAMELEHYPGMTEAAIEAMIDIAQQRFDLLGVRVVHRVGALAPGGALEYHALTKPKKYVDNPPNADISRITGAASGI